MFTQILASIICLLAYSCMQLPYHICEMQVLCHISSMQILCHVIASLQYPCQIITGTDIANAWNMPKIIGTGIANTKDIPNQNGTLLANTKNMPVKIGINLARMQTSYHACEMQRICQTYLTTSHLLTTQ